MDISSYLREYTQATVYNAAFGGCRMSSHKTSHNPFSMNTLADAITSKDYSLQKNAIANYSSLPSYFSRTVSVLENLDFANVDIITIAYGTNDFTGGQSIADVENALRYSIETIQNAYPNIDIVICSPTYRFWMDEKGNFIDDSNTREIGGVKLTDYIQLYSAVATEYGIYMIDNYNGSGINETNRAEYFNGADGVHLNKAGRQMIAEYMAKELYEEFGSTK